MFQPVYRVAPLIRCRGVRGKAGRHTRAARYLYLMLGQTAFHYEVRPGDSAEKVLDRLAYQINEAVSMVRSLG